MLVVLLIRTVSPTLNFFFTTFSHRRHNTPNKYIILVISVFSRYPYAIPLWRKRGVEVVKAIESILDQDWYGKLQTDRGSEFFNPHVEKVLLKYNTMLYHSHRPIKAAMAARLIRTIWLLISRYYTLKNSAAFIQDLYKIRQIYNQRPHQFLFNVSPQEVHRGYHDTLKTSRIMPSTRCHQDNKNNDDFYCYYFKEGFNNFTN